MTDAKVRVLFVCLGNICRSPMAEGVFARVAGEEGLGEVVDIDSAGTGSWHIDEPPDGRAQEAAREIGADISNLRGRQVRAQAVAWPGISPRADITADRSPRSRKARRRGTAARNRARSAGPEDRAPIEAVVEQEMLHIRPARLPQPGKGHVRGEFALVRRQSQIPAQPLLRIPQVLQHAVAGDAGPQRARLAAVKMPDTLDLKLHRTAGDGFERCRRRPRPRNAA